MACRDGTALLGALERRGGQQRPGAACVVLDHHHPGGLDAVGLLARMAAAGAVLPVAVATDSSDQRLTAELRRLGAAAVLEKPLLQEALFRAVLRLLGSDGHHAAAAPLPPLRAPRR